MNTIVVLDEGITKVVNREVLQLGQCTIIKVQIVWVTEVVLGAFDELQHFSITKVVNREVLQLGQCTIIKVQIVWVTEVVLGAFDERAAVERENASHGCLPLAGFLVVRVGLLHGEAGGVYVPPHHDLPPPVGSLLALRLHRSGH
uniref:Uncharacterized protein n=1 Tax=Zea mays TaxID=4577 RepID=C4J872_MAIZE|nr:unknown [Zea mays]